METWRHPCPTPECSPKNTSITEFDISGFDCSFISSSDHHDQNNGGDSIWTADPHSTISAGPLSFDNQFSSYDPWTFPDPSVIHEGQEIGARHDGRSPGVHEEHTGIRFSDLVVPTLSIGLSDISAPMNHVCTLALATPIKSAVLELKHLGTPISARSNYGAVANPTFDALCRIPIR